MNKDHLDLLAGEDWRAVLRDMILPFAFGPRAAGDLGNDVLEVGPGPGLTTDLLLPQVAALTAIEIDPTLAAELTLRLADSPTASVVEGDATSMPFETGRFSGAVSFTMLHHVPDTGAQNRLFGEVHRVLRPGGLFVASDSVASTDLAALHVDDVYNPIDPSGVANRLADVGFVDIDVQWNDFGWRAHASRSDDGVPSN